MKKIDKNSNEIKFKMYELMQMVNDAVYDGEKGKISYYEVINQIYVEAKCLIEEINSDDEKIV